MKNIISFGTKVSPEVERGIRLLKSYGYQIKKDKGYYQIFDGGEIVGYTKNSPKWIDPVKNFKGEFKNPKLFEVFQKFMAHLEFFEIPYPFDKNRTGIELLINSISRDLGELEK